MITPNEINTKRFDKASFGGYKTEDVDNYLTLIAGEFAKVLDEKKMREVQLVEVIEKIEEYKADEDALKSAIIEAKRLASSIVNDAKTKAEIIVRDANKKVEDIIEDAKFRIDKEKLTLSKMQKEVATFKTQILSLYRKHIEILDDIPEAKEAEYNFDEELNKIAINQFDEETEEPSVVEVVDDVSEDIEETDDSFSAIEMEPTAEVEKISIEGFTVSEPEIDVDENEEEIEIEAPMPKKSSRFGELKFGDEYSIKQEDDHSRFGRRKK